MATLKLAVVPAKVAKDGTHKIRVAVGHKQETRYIVTRFKIESLSHFKNGQVVGFPDASLYNVKLRNILNDYQDRLDSIKFPELYDCGQIRDIITHSDSISSDRTFKAVADRYVRELIEDSRSNYATLIERNCRYFCEFTKREILLSEINPTIINNYSRFLRNTKNLSETTIGMMMSRTRTIINKAKREQLVKYDVDPFEFYSIPSALERELDISVAELKIIRDSEPKRKIHVISRDLIMLSYYLGGINLIDLLKIDFRKTDSIEYIRTKSRNTKQGEKRISLSIPEEAIPIIMRWRNKNTGKLDFKYNFSYSNFNRYLNRGIVSLAKDLGIKSKVVYYSARKSFVQHGFELGVPLEVLEYCIGQSMKSNRPIFSYLKIMRKHADVAIRKILDSLK
ncbi:site-specific integrase [Bacteroides sp. 51]|uniref:site-specific integrase n=1 Tax=Bacteroides sp. 51 TaxID=2302938 RepID=UPI0013D7CB5B|nr:site-specific integrase [Bacteroides sp. 51]NDV81361.1 hypothetical protein [Bacteroides sp. 51]